MSDQGNADRGLVGHATVVHPRFVARVATIEDAEGVRDIADQAARTPGLEAEIERLRAENEALRHDVANLIQAATDEANG